MEQVERFAAFCRGVLTDPNGRPLELYPEQGLMLGDYFDGVRETVILAAEEERQDRPCGRPGARPSARDAVLRMLRRCRVRDQAARVLDAITGYVRRSPELSARLKIKQREVVHEGNRGFVRVLAADVDTSDGLTPTLAIVDELHRHRSAELYSLFATGSARVTAGW